MKRTPLFEAHVARGARMVEFAGWEMPVQYRGIIEEHMAVRKAAGLFDVSHMGEVEVRGDAALATCQRLTVNDVRRLRDGQAQYSLLCLPTGGVVDDIVVHRLSPTRFLFCVNAGNRDRDVAWMQEHRGDAEVIDRSDEYAQLALQGPRATAILTPLTSLPLAELPSFAFAIGTVAGRSALVAHTGYTGEDGWELYCAPGDARTLWDAILEAGVEEGIMPVGLGARDTLRVERALPLYGHELTEELTPLEAGLGWVVRWDKGDFIGHDALQQQKAAGLRRRLVGVVVQGGIPRQGYRLRHDGQVVGEITSGTKSPVLGKGIGLGYVAATSSEVGTKVAVEIRNRDVAAGIVRLPFYRRAQ